MADYRSILDDIENLIIMWRSDETYRGTVYGYIGLSEEEYLRYLEDPEGYAKERIKNDYS